MPAIETDPVTITLPRDDLGQIIDGLCCRQDAYRKTAEYHETGTCSDPTFVVEEVTDAEEARALEARYAGIIAALQAQLHAQC